MRSLPPQRDNPPPPIATGFDFEPLPDGNLLVEFYGDDGVTITSQGGLETSF